MAKTPYKAKEPVKLREKNLSNGNKSLYLDIYRNGNRYYEFLKLYIIPERTAADKVANKNTLQAAQAIKAQRIIEIANGKAKLSNRGSLGKMLLVDWLEQYRQEQERKGRKDGRQIRHTIEIVKQYNGTVRMCDIDRAYCKGYIDYLQNVYTTKQGKRLQPFTAQNYYRVLNCALNAAKRVDIISDNPFEKVAATDKIKVTESKREYLTIDEVKRLMNTPCKYESVKAAYLFSCFCGLRISDIKALTWGNIVKDGDKYRFNIIMKKTGNPIYGLLNNQAMVYLPARDGKADGELVFDLPHENYINTVLKRWAADAGINKNMTFHTARHTFATMSMTMGADLYTVSRWLGHRDISTTQIYAKIVNKKLDECVENIDKAFE